jgi:DNA-binding response OmpR family regulator
MTTTTTKGRILIADDDPQLLSMLSVRYGKHGYEIVEAQDGLQAVEKARETRPDVILLDVMMPGKNGWEVAKELKGDPDTRGIGIIMLTAIGETVNELTSPLYGVEAWLDKPFEFAELDRRIEEILASRRGG